MRDLVLDFVSRMTGGNGPVAALCRRTMLGLEEEGDVCIGLDAAEEDLLRTAPDVASFAGDGTAPADVRTPFVVQDGLLYTRRNWYYERLVLERLAALNRPLESAPVVFPADTALRPEQRDAVRAMCANRFSILTGGPGTGKTFTIAAAVDIVRRREPGLRLGLAAPTGKARQRMAESMARTGMADVPEASTIHAMLGPAPDFVTFRHNRGNPLPFDWIVVDEASMVDLPLLAKLLDAVPDDCRITFAGDADQLASVERGRVFADLCARPGLPVSRLARSERFPPGGEIARLAAAINGKSAGGADEAMAILRAPGGVASFTDLSGVEKAFRPGTWPGFAEAVRRGYAAFAACRDAASALAHLEDFRVLCALRHGPFGSEKVAAWIRRTLPDDAPVPVMVARNDRTLDVNNGDVGVVMPGDRRTLLLPGRKEGEIRPVRLELLPETECAFASTVHKAQGSQFTDVAVVLPTTGESPLLTCEILYTAVTRTEKSVAVFGGEPAVRACCGRPISRRSGLVPPAPR